jgi:hypothetical protein
MDLKPFVTKKTHRRLAHFIAPNNQQSAIILFQDNLTATEYKYPLIVQAYYYPYKF